VAGPERPLVAGLNMGHDGGCALLRGGELVCAISEERLNRHRFSPGWARSLMYALETADADLADIDLIVFSSGGPDLPAGFDGGLRRFGVDPKRFAVLDHHASHAWCAHCMSGAPESLVLVVDAVGNNEDTESWWWAGRGGVERLGRNDRVRPRSGGIGSTYEAFTNWLGFPDQESGKTMALAAFGDADAIEEPLFELVGTQVNGALPSTHQWGVEAFFASRGLALGDPFPNATEQPAKDVAAYVQREAEAAVLELVGRLLAEHPASTLCFTGGVALNCVLNSKLRDAIAPRRLFVPPASSDVGQPLGNALYGHWRLTGEVPAGSARWQCPGRGYSETEIAAALEEHPLVTPYGRLRREQRSWGRESNPAETAAQLLAEGKTVGWLQAGSEFGPRALGHRSILADPRTPASRDHLNRAVKHREWFRPFAPSIPRERAGDLVGVDGDFPYMLEAPTIREEWVERLAGVVHVDGTARVQTVCPEMDPRFHDLILRFECKTGVPAVLNTSFNDREPIVETPGDALLTFQAGRLDALIVGDTAVFLPD
jgi:predicted NodU family carbamoyl transferase